MSNQRQPVSLLTPTAAKERIQALDLLRGFAIFGMFFTHMTRIEDQSGLDLLLGWVGFSLFTTKAVSLFSLLFGFGFALQMQRAELRNSPFLPFYLRRVLGLLIIGNLIMLLGIANNVLTIYALFSLVLIPLRKCSSKVVLLVAGLFASVYIIADTLTSVPEYFGDLQLVAAIARERLTDAQRAEAMQICSQGSFGAIVSYRYERLVWWWTHWRQFLYEVEIIGLMLFGMFVARKGWLHDIPRYLWLFRRALIWGFGLGLLLTTFGATRYWLHQEKAIGPALWLFGNLAFYPFGSWLMVSGYAGALVLASQNPRWRRKLYPLAAIGRMALTNFILTYIPYSYMVYGWGLGLWGQLTSTQTFMVMLVQLPLQAAFSVWWLRHFRFGPLEWVWRCFTYASLQPLRHRSPDKATA